MNCSAARQHFAMAIQSSQSSQAVVDAIERLIEKQTDSQNAILDELRQIVPNVKRVAVAAEATGKAAHFLERRQDSKGGLLTDWRRHKSQYSQGLNDPSISEEEKSELAQQYSLSQKDRLTAILKGSCFAPCLLLIR